MRAFAGLFFFFVLGWSSSALTFTDGTGRTLEIDHPPAAVGSLCLMTDEFVAALLPSDRIRAYSRSVDDPVLSNVVAAGKTVKGRLWTNLETVVSLHPDLVLAADWADTGDLDFLRKKGFAVYVVKTPRSWEEVKARIKELGQVLGVQARAGTVLDDLGFREQKLADRRSQVTKKISVMEYNSFGSSMGTGTLWSDILSLAGVVNSTAALPVNPYGYASISLEMLVTLDPDWLVLPSQGALAAYSQPDFLDRLRADPLFARLRAVRSGQILYLPESLKTSTSQAVLGAAEAIQHATYPDLR